MADTLVDALNEAAKAQGSPLTEEQAADISEAFFAGDGGNPNAVTGSSDPTLVSVKQPVGMAPGGYNYKPYVEYETFEGNAQSLTDLNNSQSWLSRVMSSDDGYNSLVAALKGIGAISTDDPTWGTVAAAARAALSSAGSRSQEFWSFVNDRTVQDPLDDGPSGGGGGMGRAPRLPSRTEQVDLTNEGTATQVLNTAMLESVGREATAKEVAAFTQLLNSEETDNPLYRQDTPIGLADTNVERGGGISKELLAAEFADGTPGAKEYKMATEGMEAVEDWFAKQIGLF
jgi:hypothetical protein